MEIIRKSHVADAILLEFTGKMLEYLPKDLPRFTAYDPDLNNEKVTLLRNAYLNALSYGTDQTEVGILQGLTEKVSGELRSCISIFKDVRYFARKKFSHSPAILKELCLDKYEKARKSQPEMVVFMYELEKAVQKYKTDLLSAGLKETAINSIGPAAVALEKSNVGQESGKKGRNVKTEDRVILINKLYDLLLEFSDASRRVFEGDPLSRSRYVLPYSKSTAGADLLPAK